MKSPTIKPESDPCFFSTQVSQASRFYLDLKPSPQAILAVVSGGLEHCAANYRVERKTFPFCSVEYVTRGSGILKLKQHKLTLKPGMIFSYGPEIAHEIINDPERPMSKYFIDFSG
jgi:hypothetical protein